MGMAAHRKHDTDLILDSARALVLRVGPRAASVKAIAAASGAPVGTLYHRFGSRDGVLAAAWLRALERFAERAMASARAGAGPVESAAGMSAAAIGFARDEPDDAQLLLSVRRDDLLDAAPGDDFRTRLDEINTPLAAELRRIARELHGRAGERAVETVTRAVVDVPYAAIRRRGRDLPAWLEEDVAASTRALLQPRI